ncbi:MAG: hypothetical protein ACREJB_02165 [Planctomycetaceae bacterium]
MSSKHVTINRTLVGVLALGCLAAALALWLAGPDQESLSLWQAGFVRVGLVLVALWIALPSRHRPAAWANLSLPMFIGGLIALVALLRIPLRILLPLAVVLAIVGVLVRPRGRFRPPR